ncbi:MAG: protoporphyrinogen oxidase [Tannerella sp.]|jgi:oxygen-dependent protoporphyrinogen oxidase|nr:protoporphyrinogen oxidase [Tannerella sp.]
METKQIDVAVIGAGITGLTTAFLLQQKGKQVHLLERANRTGGQIQTFHEAGFTFESGPNTGTVSCPEVVELFTRLHSTSSQLEVACKAAKRRLIWKKDRFHALPSGLLAGITTPLFTYKDKIRLLGEPFRSKGTTPDESVGQLACRRLGKSFFNYAVDPFISGIYAGDPMKLVTRYALPKLYNLEQNYGGFIRGSIAKMKEPKTTRDRLATKEIFSVTGGLENLTIALAGQIGSEHISLSVSNTVLQPLADGRWQISCMTPQGEQTFLASKVVTTVGAYCLPKLIPFVPSELMDKITNLRYAPVIQASVGIRDTGALHLNAFGGLIPSIEQKPILGILFPSSCFSSRAPHGGALFSFFMGGVRHPEMMEWTDDEIRNVIVTHLHSMLRFPSNISPDLIRIFRHSRAIPQYGQSSGERFEAISRIENQYPGLILAGNIRNGISLADRIRQASLVAETMIG